VPQFEVVQLLWTDCAEEGLLALMGLFYLAEAEFLCGGGVQGRSIFLGEGRGPRLFLGERAVEEGVSGLRSEFAPGMRRCAFCLAAAAGAAIRFGVVLPCANVVYQSVHSILEIIRLPFSKLAGGKTSLPHKKTLLTRGSH
jgi:hypothetical protein